MVRVLIYHGSRRVITPKLVNSAGTSGRAPGISIGVCKCLHLPCGRCLRLAGRNHRHRQNIGTSPSVPGPAHRVECEPLPPDGYRSQPPDPADCLFLVHLEARHLPGRAWRGRAGMLGAQLIHPGSYQPVIILNPHARRHEFAGQNKYEHTGRGRSAPPQVIQQNPKLRVISRVHLPTALRDDERIECGCFVNGRYLWRSGAEAPALRASYPVPLWRSEPAANRFFARAASRAGAACPSTLRVPPEASGSGRRRHRRNRPSRRGRSSCTAPPSS